MSLIFAAPTALMKLTVASTRNTMSMRDGILAARGTALQK
jgi:hypothetical protein